MIPRQAYLGLSSIVRSIARRHESRDRGFRPDLGDLVASTAADTTGFDVPRRPRRRARSVTVVAGRGVHDPYDDVRPSINRLRLTPFLAHKDHIAGFVDDVADGGLYPAELDDRRRSGIRRRASRAGR